MGRRSFKMLVSEENMEEYAKKLYEWCRIPAGELLNHPDRKVPFRMVEDSREMGLLMANELIDHIIESNQAGRIFRTIIPCGPNCWYKDFVRIVNEKHVSLKKVVVFHMDECLDYQGNLLPKNHPYNFRTFMEKNFYGGVKDALSVPPENRYFLEPASMSLIREKIWEAPIDFTMGGWGQDGHIAYNQARRLPYSKIGIKELKETSIHIQNNNDDTILALANRTFGAAYQFVPPMSITLGIKECLSAKKIRLFSDTGAWKMTALRAALFSEVTPEYPITLLQEHPDAVITATRETASHPISLHPEWEL